MTGFFKKNSWVIIFLICLILPICWFHTGKIFGGGEEGLAYYNPVKTFELSRNMWWDLYGGLPTLAWLPNVYPFAFLAFLYSQIHVPNVLLQGGLYGLLLLVGSFSTYFLIKDFLPKKDSITPLIGGIFYVLNPFSMSQIWGRGLTAQFFTFALLPLGLLLFLRGLRGKRFLYVLMFGLASTFFSSAFGITTFVFDYWAVITIAFIFWILLESIDHKKTVKDYFYYFLYYISTLFIWTVSSINWLLPTALTGNTIYAGQLESSQDNISTLIGTSLSFKFPTIIRLLQDHDFFDPGSSYGDIYSTLLFQVISILIPIFLIIGFFFVLRKRELKFFWLFIAIFVMGLFVSLGSNPPLGWLFVKFFKHISFLQGFRNPYEKFGIVYAFGYSPLFALGLSYFYQKILKNKTIGLLFITFVLLLVSGIYLWPMWSGRIVSAPNLREGTNVPFAYTQVNDWFKANDRGSFRVIMTPIWPGDGAFYQWQNTLYNGLDPMIFLVDVSTISNNPSNIQFYSDFMNNIRENIYKENVIGALNLFRIKYLINRNDAVIGKEKRDKQFLTQTIFPPDDVTNLSEVACQNLSGSVSPGNDQIHFNCSLDKAHSDLSKIRYLQVVIKVNQDADLEFAMQDIHATRPRWYGTTPDSYFIPANKWTNILIPLDVPTEGFENMDFSHVRVFEIMAHPIGDINGSVKTINVQGVWYNPGQVEKVNNFTFVQNFGNLQLYKATNFIVPPEFGLLHSVESVNNLDELITKAYDKSKQLDKHGFIVVNQNDGKSINALDHGIVLQTGVVKKLSDTRYWIKTKNNGAGLLLLSKSFNPTWKVIPGIDESELNGSFWNDIKLLKESYLSEDNHFVANGYANLWKISGSKSYAVVFLPQIFADIGAEISLTTIIIILVILLIYFLIGKRKYKFIKNYLVRKNVK